jgi:multicomponent Na+:H+ antiporter subunit E
LPPPRAGEKGVEVAGLDMVYEALGMFYHGHNAKESPLSGVVTFILLAVLWVIFSGKLDLFHLSLGAVSCLLVTLCSGRLLFQERGKSFATRLGEIWRFTGFAFWLLLQIVLANFHVISLALSRRRMEQEFDPYIFSFTTVLRSDFAKFVLANSITLTPGTVTIRIEGDTFWVHAISRKAAGDLSGSESVGEMERRIACVFAQDNMCFLAERG